MKRRFITLLTILCSILFLLGAVACKKEEPSIFADFDDKTLTVEAGDIVDVSPYMSVMDKDGNEYSTSLFIEDSQGNAVEHMRYAFKATDKNGYKATVYAKALDGTILDERILTIKVQDTLSPNIKIGEIPYMGFIGNSYALSYTISDASVVSHSVRVNVKNTDGSLGAEVALENGKFTPTQTGSYLITITANDAINAESVKTQEMVIRNSAERYVLENFDDPISAISLQGAQSGSSKETGVWLEKYKGRTGVVKAEKAYGFYIRFMQTLKELKAFDDDSWDYISIDAYFDVGGDITSLFFINSTNGYEPAFKGGTWQELRLTKDHIITACGRRGTDGLLHDGVKRYLEGASFESSGYSMFWLGMQADVYFDEIRFAKTIENTTPTEKQVNETVTLTANAENLDCSFVYQVVSPAYETVAVTDNAFVADTIGRYTVYTTVSEQGVYGKTTSYIDVVGDYEIRLDSAETAQTTVLRGERITVPSVSLYTSAGQLVTGGSVTQKIFFNGTQTSIAETTFTVTQTGSYDILYICEYGGIKITKTHTVKVESQYANYVESFTSAESVNRIGIIADKRETNETAVWQDEFQGKYGVVSAIGEEVNVPDSTDKKTEFRFVSTWLKSDFETYSENNEWNTFTIWLYIDVEGSFTVDFARDAKDSHLASVVTGKTWTAVSITRSHFETRDLGRRFALNQDQLPTWNGEHNPHWIDYGSLLRIRNLTPNTRVYFDSMLFENVAGVDPNSLIETYETSESIATNFVQGNKSGQNATATWLDVFEGKSGVLQTKGEYLASSYSTKTSFYLKSSLQSTALQTLMQSGEYDYISVKLYIDKVGEYAVDFGPNSGDDTEKQTVSGKAWVEIKFSITGALNRSLYNHICANNPNSNKALFNIDKLSADTAEELPASPDVWVYIDQITFGKNPPDNGDGTYTDVYK